MHKTPRGRPRCEASETNIRVAALELLLEVGYEGFTLEAVARRARVGRPTIYRWWTGKPALVADVLLARLDATASFVRKKTLRATLAAQMRRVVSSFCGVEGRWLISLIVAAQSDAEVARLLRERFLLPRREAAVALLRRAVEAGELRDEVEPEVLVDALYAPFYHRLLMGLPLDASLVDRLLEVVLDGVTPRPQPRKQPRRAR